MTLILEQETHATMEDFFLVTVDIEAFLKVVQVSINCYYIFVLGRKGHSGSGNMKKTFLGTTVSFLT